MRLARLQHSVLLAVAAGEKVDLGILHSFNSGVAPILEGNRDANDVELLALENLLDQAFSPSGGEASATPSPEASSPSGESAGDAESSQEPESVTAVAPPDAGVAPAPALDSTELAAEENAHLAPGEPPVTVMDVDGEPFDEEPAPEHVNEPAVPAAEEDGA